MSKRKRPIRILVAAAAGALVLLTAPVWGIRIGRNLSWFEVQRVEVAGARLLAPHDLLQISGIRPGLNILDDPAPWVAALRAHPVVRDVRITRRAPSTLRIRVDEKLPVAFVGDDVLELATGTGEILPVDPSAAPIDLPIVRSERQDSAGAAALRTVLAETARLTALDPRIMSEVSEIALAPREPGVLLMVHPLGDILLPLGATEPRLAELRAVLGDLARKRPVPDGAARLDSRATLDLRFDAQVVVRHPPPRELT